MPLQRWLWLGYVDNEGRPCDGHLIVGYLWVRLHQVDVCVALDNAITEVALVRIRGQ